jgi:hypothetical protein
LDEWLNEDIESRPVDLLADDLVELEEISGLLEATRLRRLKVFDRKTGHHTQGYPSSTAFLMAKCRMRAGRAMRQVARAHALDTATHVLEAWMEGRIGTDQSYELFRISTLVPDRFATDQQSLVEIVQDLSVGATRRVLDSGGRRSTDPESSTTKPCWRIGVASRCRPASTEPDVKTAT